MRLIRHSHTASLALALLLAACSYQPTIRHPTLAQVAPVETTMSCPQVDLAIDRADTVRWVIRDDGGHLATEAQRAARAMGNVALLSLTLLGGGVPTGVDDGGYAVLSAADVRIRQLLELKRSHGCPPRPTAIPGMDDLAVLAALEQVHKQLAAGGDEAALLTERTRLLDGLRVVPTPPARP